MEFVPREYNVSLWLYILFKIIMLSSEFVPVQICDVSECIADVMPFFPDPDKKILHFNIFSFSLEWVIKHEIY